MSVVNPTFPVEKGISVEEFERIFKAYWIDVYKICHFYTKDEMSAADLTQNVFTLAWEKRQTLVSNGLIKHYLCRSAKLEARNFNRVKQVRDQKLVFTDKKMDELATTNVTEFDLLYKEAEQRMQMALSLIPEKSKEIFHLSHYEGLGRDAIAKKLNLRPKTVEYHLYKVVAFVKSKF